MPKMFGQKENQIVVQQNQANIKTISWLKISSFSFSINVRKNPQVFGLGV
jgi:hypothetical protein